MARRGLALLAAAVMLTSSACDALDFQDSSPTSKEGTAYRVYYADPGKELGAWADLAPDGSVLRSGQNHMQGLAVVRWSGNHLDAGSDRSARMWHFSPSSVSGTQLAAGMTAVQRGPDGDVYRTQRWDEPQTLVQQTLQRVTPGGAVRAQTTVQLYTESITVSGDELYLTGYAKAGGPSRIVVVNRRSLRVRRTFTISAVTAMHRCLPVRGGKAIMCSEGRQADDGVLEGTLSMYDAMTGKRLAQASPPGSTAPDYTATVEVLPDPGGVIVVTNKAVYRWTGGDLQRLTGIDSAGRVLVRSTRTGDLVDIHMRHLENADGDGKIDMGVVIRVDVRSGRVLRTTHLQVPDFGFGGSSVVIPREFLDGKAVYG